MTFPNVQQKNGKFATVQRRGLAGSQSVYRRKPRLYRHNNVMLSIPISLEGAAKMPTYATDGAAGMDLYSVEPISIQPFERFLAKTGVRMAIPPGYEGQIRPRSGLALRLGLSMVNSPGTIDSDYRGEIGVILINLSQTPIELAAGERIAQLVICPVAKADLVLSPDLDSTQRGDGGFGSTGRA